MLAAFMAQAYEPHELCMPDQQPSRHQHEPLQELEPLLLLPPHTLHPRRLAIPAIGDSAAAGAPPQERGLGPFTEYKKAKFDRIVATRGVTFTRAGVLRPRLRRGAGGGTGSKVWESMSCRDRDQPCRSGRGFSTRGGNVSNVMASYVSLPPYG